MIATSTSNHNVLLKHSVTNYFLVMVVTPILFFVKYQCIIFLPFLTTISNYEYNNTLNQKKKNTLSEKIVSLDEIPPTGIQ